MLAKYIQNLDIGTMNSFQEIEKRGKSFLWTTPEDGMLFELAGSNPNTGTLWAYHLYLEQGTELLAPDENGWAQLLPPSRLNGQYGEKVREIDAPLPPYRQLGRAGIQDII